jgi:hypothetical protein
MFVPVTVIPATTPVISPVIVRLVLTPLVVPVTPLTLGAAIVNPVYVGPEPSSAVIVLRDTFKDIPVETPKPVTVTFCPTENLFADV